MLAGMYIKLIAAGVIIAAALGAVWYVNNLQETVEEQKAVIIQKEANIKQLGAAIEQQNAAVDALKKDADARLAAAETKLVVARAETAKAKSRATIIYKEKPSDPNDLCKSALDLVNGGAK